MSPTINDNNIFEFEPFEEDGYALMLAETSWRGMADELQELHNLKGAQLINQLKLIVYYGDFHPVEGFRVSGFFRLAEAWLIKNKVVPLHHGTYKAASCHPSRCAYRQLRRCQF